MDCSDPKAVCNFGNLENIAIKVVKNVLIDVTQHLESMKIEADDHNVQKILHELLEMICRDMLKPDEARNFNDSDPNFGFDFNKPGSVREEIGFCKSHSQIQRKCLETDRENDESCKHADVDDLKCGEIAHRLDKEDRSKESVCILQNRRRLSMYVKMKRIAREQFTASGTTKTLSALKKQQQHSRLKYVVDHKPEILICFFCEPNICLQDRRNLVKHMQDIHAEELQTGKCATCRQNFPSRHNYEFHVKKQVELKCTDCGKHFRNASDLIQHVLTHDLETEKRLKSVRSALGGGITVSNKLTPSCFKCKTCLRIFTIHPVYKRHLRLSSQAKKLPNPRKCPECDFESTNVCLMGVHVESHKTEKENLCGKCKKTFRTANALIRHELEHEGKLNGVCKNCGAYFRSVFELDKHTGRCMNEAQSFECSDCKRVFTSHWRLREHGHLHRVSVYFCDQCGREFKHLLNLNRHVNSRCGTEPWIFCDFCKMGFYSRKVLAAHLREQHTTASMFICQYCGGEFLTRAQLTRHETRHNS